MTDFNTKKNAFKAHVCSDTIIKYKWGEREFGSELLVWVSHS